MTIDTANLRTLASAATPGPWAVKLGHATFGDGTQVAYVMEDAPDPCRVVAYEVGLPEASFIAAASPSVVLALLDEVEDLRHRIEAAEAGAMAANDAAFGERVEHVELNGHIDTAKECCDYLDHEAMDDGDPSGKLRDFATSLSICIQQLDRTRRRLNWFETAYTTGRRKVIESATADVRQQLAASQAEVERLRQQQDIVLRQLALIKQTSSLGICIEQRDAALNREDELRSALFAVTAARDEACEIAEAAIFVIDNGLCPQCRNSIENIHVERIDDLRKVGQP
jgi:hypothetical protein